MNELDYLTAMPTEVPAGRLLVHNHVRPTRRLGSRGFRAWLADQRAENYEVCGCGWAPELGEHYLSRFPGRPELTVRGRRWARRRSRPSSTCGI